MAVRQVRTHAFERPDAGLWLWPDELAALVGLPAWHLALFAHLVLRSDFGSGHGRTGYGELINALTPDQPERGPRLWAPSRDDCKAALRRLEALRLVALDRGHSERVQALVFHVQPRTRRGVPAPKLPPKLSPGPHEGETGKLTPGTGPGLPALNTYPLPPVDKKLSTAAGPSDADRQRMREVRARIGGGRKRAPQGA